MYLQFQELFLGSMNHQKIPQVVAPPPWMKKGARPIPIPICASKRWPIPIPIPICASKRRPIPIPIPICASKRRPIPILTDASKSMPMPETQTTLTTPTTARPTMAPHLSMWSGDLWQSMGTWNDQQKEQQLQDLWQSMETWNDQQKEQQLQDLWQSMETWNDQQKEQQLQDSWQSMETWNDQQKEQQLQDSWQSMETWNDQQKEQTWKSWNDHWKDQQKDESHTDHSHEFEWVRVEEEEEEDKHDRTVKETQEVLHRLCGSRNPEWEPQTRRGKRKCAKKNKLEDGKGLCTRIDVRKLMYAQESCKQTFQCGRSILQLVHDLLDKRVSLNASFLILTVFQTRDGKTNKSIYRCIDTRRLWALKEYAKRSGRDCVMVNVNLFSQNTITQVQRFVQNSDDTDGRDVRLRKKRNKKGNREQSK